MGDRVPFVVGILALAAVVAWLVIRDDTAQSPPPPPAESVTRRPAKIAAPEAPTLPAASQAPTAAPSLPPEPPVDPSAPGSASFAAEARDDGWAASTEREIQKRWKQIRGGKLVSAECRRSQCKLVVGGSQDDVSTAIADLEGSRGFHGFAQGVLLTSPETASDGSITLQVFARFER